jgi:hypothetical protein
VNKAIKRRIKDDLGTLGHIKRLRNKLAHGAISFTECAEDVTVAQLTELKDNTSNYLREIIECFIAYIKRSEFLAQGKSL